MEKCQFWGFWNRYFHCPERFVCYIKGRRSFFHDLFSRSITWESRGYMGLQGVTRGYMRLQGVTGGYKELYKFFCKLERSQIVLLGWFCIKIEVEEIFGLSPLKKCQFCVVFKSMFILSKKACLLTRTSPNIFSRCNLVKTKR